MKIYIFLSLYICFSCCFSFLKRLAHMCFVWSNMFLHLLTVYVIWFSCWDFKIVQFNSICVKWSYSLTVIYLPACQGYCANLVLMSLLVNQKQFVFLCAAFLDRVIFPRTSQPHKSWLLCLIYADRDREVFVC